MSSQKTYPQNESVMFTLAQRLTNLVDEKKYQGINAKEQARALTISEASMSKYTHQKMEMRVSTLKEIAEYYNVSSDYLLGLSQYRPLAESTDSDLIRKMCNYTGLDEESIESLHAVTNTAHIEIINFILHNNELLKAIFDYYTTSLVALYMHSDYFCCLNDKHPEPEMLKSEPDHTKTICFAALLDALSISRDTFQKQIESDYGLALKMLLAMAQSFVDIEWEKRVIGNAYATARINAIGNHNEYVDSKLAIKKEEYDYKMQLLAEIEHQATNINEDRFTKYRLLDETISACHEGIKSFQSQIKP